MPNVGDVFKGRWRIMEEHGGGMSFVYRAVDLTTSREVALKQIPLTTVAQALKCGTDKIEQRAQREVATLKAMKHPGIPGYIFDFKEGDDFFVAMDWFEGQTLEAILKAKTRRFDEKDIKNFLVTILGILEYLHGQKPQPIIYRDLKPSNIIMTAQGAKLIDFGIVVAWVAQQQTQMLQAGQTLPTGTVALGTPEYAPIEQAAGNPNPKSDQYALGCVAFEMLSGKTPARLTQPPPIRTVRPDISTDLEEVLQKLTEPKHDERYQSAREAREFIENIGKPKVAPPPIQAPTGLLQTAQPTQTATGWKGMLHGLGKKALELVSGESASKKDDKTVEGIIKFCETVLDGKSYKWVDANRKQEATAFLQGIKNSVALNATNAVAGFYDKFRGILFKDVVAANGKTAQETVVKSNTTPPTLIDIAKADASTLSPDMVAILVAIKQNQWVVPRAMGITQVSTGMQGSGGTITTLMASVGDYWYVIQ